MAELTFALAIAGLIAAAVINIAFAIAVHTSALAQERKRALLFVAPWVWALATLVGGVFVAAAFWLMHLSSLRNQPEGTSGVGPSGVR